MKSKKRKGFILLAACAAAAFCAGLIMAARSDSVSVTNHLETGDVDIGISEFTLSGGKETAYKNPAAVSPGDCISKIPRITSYSSPCYVRAKISFTNSQKELEGLSEGLVGGIGKDWKKAGGYYYYTKPLKKGEHTDLFSTVTIPASWTDEHNGQTLGLTIRADAIQASNFTPDFDAMSPWGNQEIELCVHERDDQVVERTESLKNTVIYEGDAHKLVAAPDDFFSNLSALMPGDSAGDSVEIKNTADVPAELFFYAGYENQTKVQVDLLKALEIQIKYGDKEIYKGSLTQDSLNGGISLGTFAPGTGGKMDFVITMPSSLGNAYARRNADVKWVFMVKEDAAVSPSPIASPDPGGNSQAGTSAAGGHSSQGEKSAQPSPVKTGDDNALQLLLILLFASAAAAMKIAVKKRRDH